MNERVVLALFLVFLALLLLLLPLKALPADKMYGGNPWEMEKVLIAQGRIPRQKPQSFYYAPPVPGETDTQMVNRWLKAWCNGQDFLYWSSVTDDCVELGAARSDH